MHLGLLGDPVVCVHALNRYVADVNAWNAAMLEKQAVPHLRDQKGKDELCYTMSVFLSCRDLPSLHLVFNDIDHCASSGGVTAHCGGSCEPTRTESMMTTSQGSVAADDGKSAREGTQGDVPEVPAAEADVPFDDRRWDSSMVPDADKPVEVLQKGRSRLRAFLAAVRGRGNATSSAASTDDVGAPEAGDQGSCCSDMERAAGPLGDREAATPARLKSSEPSMEQPPGAASGEEQRSSISSNGGSSGGRDCEARCSPPQQSVEESVDWAKMNNSMMQSLHHMITGIITATIVRVRVLSHMVGQVPAHSKTVGHGPAASARL